MTTPALIAQIEPPQVAGGGDYFYRTYIPGRAMAEAEGMHVVNLTSEHRLREEVTAEADVLILKDICDPDFLPCIKRRNQQGKKTFYEISDDLKAVPSWNPVYFFYQDVENQRLFQRLARACHGLQFTCKRLQDLYGRLNDRCRVFPNQIPELPEERVFENNKQFVIGWGGSHGHLEDMAKIASDLMQWIHNHSDVHLHLMCSDPIWDLFGEIPASQKRHTKPGTIDDYYRFLKSLNVGLIPVEDTGFNCSRSDVKFLEYAAAGVAAVIRKLNPYNPYEESAVNGENALIFEIPAQMIACLEKLYHDRGLVEKLARTARSYVRQNRMQKDHVRERLEFYGCNAIPDSAGGSGCDFFEKWSRAEGAKVQGRHLQLRSSRFELLLHDGLVLMQVRKDPVQANRYFEEAVGLEPGNYLPYLFSAPIAADPISRLKKALRLKPDSLKAWIMLGEQYGGMGKVMEGIQSFEIAARLHPEYEIPYLRTVDLLDRIGNKTEAQKLKEKADKLICDF